MQKRVGDSFKLKELTCFRCGRNAKCRVSAKVVCQNCGKKGHLQRACKGSRPPVSNRWNVRRVKEQSPETSERERETDLIGNVSLHATTASKSTPPCNYG